MLYHRIIINIFSIQNVGIIKEKLKITNSGNND